MVHSIWIKQQLVKLLKQCARGNIHDRHVRVYMKNIPIRACIMCKLENGRTLSGEVLLADREEKLVPIFAVIDDGKIHRTHFFNDTTSTWST